MVPTAEHIDPDAQLTRGATAAALTAHGYHITTAGLSRHAWAGTGPAYRRFGRVTTYKWSDALEWAQARAPLRRSASEIVPAVAA